MSKYCFHFFSAVLFSLIILPVQAQLYINEFMASNATTIVDESGDYDDWIEIYNAGASDIDLAGYFITDNAANPTLWQIPAGSAAITTVPAGGHLLLWADSETIEGNNHVNFKLSAGGEFIGLYESDGSTLVDSLSFGAQAVDQSYGRLTDASPIWTSFVTATPGSPNSGGGGGFQTYIAVYMHRIEAGTDDAEQTGISMNLVDTAIQIGGASQYVGLRFPNIQLTQGQIVTEAFIQFQSQDLGMNPAQISIWAEAADNAATFNNGINNISARTKTDSLVLWNPDEWDDYYISKNDQRTSDLSEIITEVINRPNWNAGNAIAFIMEGTDTRIFSAFEEDTIDAARLVIRTALQSNADTISDLVINEFLSNNNDVIFDEFDQDEDWVELYNAGASAVNIGGLYLTDSYNDLLKWQIAYPLTIPAGGYGLIFLDDDPNQGGLHSNKVRLDMDGDEIALVQLINGDTLILDSISFGSQETNVSMGRFPDGSANIQKLCPPTPNATNATSQSVVAQPVFSLNPGIYTGTKSLQITCETPGATIRYTTDGSIPTASSTIFSGSLNLSSTTVIRARAFLTGWKESEPLSGSFFFNLNHDLPVTSFITDPDSFFGAALGIYIYDNAAIANRKNWVRRGHFEWYDTTQTLFFSGEFDTKLFGRTAIFFAQKSLSFDAMPGEEVNKAIFSTNPDVSTYKSFMLRSSSDDWSRTMFADGFQQAMFDNYTILGVQRYQPTVLYINGAYYGINNGRDKYNEDFLRFNYGVDEDNLDFIKKIPGGNSGTNEVLAGDEQHYLALKNYVHSNDISQTTHYDYIKTQMVIDDYIDFCIAEQFVGNTSWRHNRRFWRVKSPAGRWRWLINDLDRGYQWGKRNTNILNEFQAHDDLFGQIDDNQAFKDEYAQRAATWMNTLFLPTNVVAFVDSVQDNIENEIPSHVAKWSAQGGLSSVAAWNNYVQEFRDFASYRPPLFKSQLSTQLGIPATMFTLNIVVGPDSGGTVHVNDIEYQVPWNYTGDYFINTPFKIKAIPAKGYRFIHWLETGNTNAEIILNTAVNTTLTPIFTERDPKITEIHYNPANGDQYEFIELYNPSDLTMDLSNYYFDEGIRDTLYFSMPPQSYVVIARDSTLYMGQGFPVYQWGEGSLNDAGETIRLRYPDGETSEKVTYNDKHPWPEGADGDGPSLALKNVSLDNDKGRNWKACCGFISPGQANDLPVRAPGNVGTDLQLWLKADYNDFDWLNSDPIVHHWQGMGQAFSSANQTDSSRYPVYLHDSLNNNGLVSFDGQNDFLEFADITDVRTVFWVGKLNDPLTTDWMTVFGDDANFHFHGGDNGKIFAFNYADPAVKNGSWRLNGTNFTDPNTIHTGDYSMLSLITTGPVESSYLGSDREIAGRFWDGEMAEVLIYNRALTNTERNQVESYLNIKYGINIPVANHLYYNHTNYPHRIAGIGKDDSTQCLIQKSSQSVEAGSFVKMRKPADLQDGEYLVWGDNDSSIATFDKNYNGQLGNGISRIWRVAETGDVGQVRIEVDPTNLPEGVDVMFVSTNTVFFSGTTKAIKLEQGSQNLIGNYDFQDGEYFTFGKRRSANPGGVAGDLKIWLETQSLTDYSHDDEVDYWLDISGNDHDAKELGADLPVYKTDSANQLNFHPTMRFDKKRLATDSLHFYDDAISLFVVGKMNANSDLWARYVHTSSVEHYWLGRRSSNNAYAYMVQNNGAFTALGTITDWDMLSNVIEYGNGKFYENGKLLDNRSITIPPHHGLFSIGGNASGNINGEKLDGNIAEIIVYDGGLTGTERLQVQSYLAIKYGIGMDQTSPQNYLASNGSIIWDAGINAGYGFNLAGLGRDDTTFLNQTHSHSSQAGDIVEMELASPITQDRQFLIWGHDGDNLTEVIISGQNHIKRLDRTWKVAETGEVGSSSVTFDLTGLGLDLSDPTEYGFLKDDNAALSSPDLLVIVPSLNGERLTFDNVDLEDGEFFSLATLLTCTGGPKLTNINLTSCDPMQVGVDTAYYLSAGLCDSLVITTTDLEVTPPVLSASGILCPGVELTADPPGSDEYEWYLDGVFYSNSGLQNTFNSTTAGQWTVRRKVGTCWSPESNALSITASPDIPTLSIQGGLPACEGVTIIANGSTADTYDWYLNGTYFNSTVVNSFITVIAGDWTVKAKSAIGCESAFSNAMSIDDIPALPNLFVDGGGPGCLGSTFIAGPGGGEEYEWYRDGLFASNSGADSSYTYPTLGSWKVRVRIGSCWSDFSNEINVTYCPEECDNGIDDDGDGLTDCLDRDCVGSIDCDTACAPGHILAGLDLWIHGDQGIAVPGADVQTWEDQSPRNNDALQIITTDQPTHNPNQLNGHGVVSFDGSLDWMKINNNATTLTDSSTVFAVFIPYQDGGDGYYISTHFGGSNRIKMGHRVNGELIYDDDAITMATGNWHNLVTMTSFNVYSTKVEGYVNGNPAPTWTNPNVVGADRASIGQEYDSQGLDHQTSNHWDGDLAEMIIYDWVLEDSQRYDIETYLSIKYGLTIPVGHHKYYTHSSHPKGMAGVGISAAGAACLNQLSGQNTTDTAILRIENPTDAQDGEYLVWGHDDQSAAWADRSFNVPGGFKERILRTWAANVVGSPGAVDLKINLNGLGWTITDPESWVVLVDTDDNFSNATAAPFISQAVSGDTLIISGVALQDGQRFTFASRHLVRLEGKAFLSGPWEFLTGIMHDNLRSAGLLPSSSPYVGVPIEYAAEGLFDSTGNNAAVDWIVLELRDAVDSVTVISSHAMLLQRDGTIMMANGDSSLNLWGVSAGNYFLAIRHRNHLSTMLDSVFSLNTTTTFIDFTLGQTYGVAAQKEMTLGIFGLWAGDANQDGQIVFQGGFNDPGSIFLRVLSDPGNVSFARNYVAIGYEALDTNLDGQIVFQGGGSDTNPIFLGVLSHPGNVAFSRNFVIEEQLPE